MSDEEVPGRTVIRLDNARALRAYAHPVRMKLILALRTRGPLTATQAGRLLGESSGTCSFHLRQLAKYGLVEETGEGVGREKPWRATATSTAWDDVPADPETAAAAGLLVEVLAESYFAQLMQYLDISVGSIFASVIPDTVRSRVNGAFSAINYGTRPLGALLGGLLGTAVGLRPALWVAVIGSVAGAALLVPSPLPRFRLPG